MVGKKKDAKKEFVPTRSTQSHDERLMEASILYATFHALGSIMINYDMFKKDMDGILALPGIQHQDMIHKWSLAISVPIVDSLLGDVRSGNIDLNQYNRELVARREEYLEFVGAKK